MANVHIRFNDDIESYEPSDSENEYTEKEKEILRKTRKSASDSDLDSEEEVFGLSVESSDNENSDSDIENKNLDDELPNVRAWGKKKQDFYSTDYVDQDYGGYQGKDATEAEFEEEEAREIQKRLAEQLNDEDFSLDIFKNKDAQIEANDTEIIQTDKSSLSKRELRQLLQNESPELFVLINDYKEKMELIKSFLYPMIEKYKEGNLPDSEAIIFVNTYYQLILNYCTNIQTYLLLKASKIDMKVHPIMKRLYQYRQLISQLESVYEEIIKPQIDIILNTVSDPNESIKQVKKLKILDNLEKSMDAEEAPVEKPDVDAQMESESEKEEQSEEGKTDEDQDSRRAITYQMQKNKGLTPHRKKELRNPRVKHRNKFRKALIRRKGAVREVRKELTRYAGEISGIKASVSKSVKFK